MATIYVIEGTKEVLKKSRTHSTHKKGMKKIIKIFKYFFHYELLLEHPPFFSYIMLTFKVIIYIFSKIIGEAL